MLALVAAHGDGHIVLGAAGLAGHGVEVTSESRDLERVRVITLGPGYPAVAPLPPHAGLVALGLQVVIRVGGQEVE